MLIGILTPDHKGRPAEFLGGRITPITGGFVECIDTTAGMSRLAECIRPKATARYAHIACQGLQRLDIKSIRYNTLLTN